MADGSIRIDITADDSDIKKKLDGVEDAAEDAADSLDDLGDSSDKAGGGFDIMNIAAGGLVAGGISALISGVMNAAASIINLAEETREYREDMAKLETAFKTAGHSTEDASEIYKDFYAILGESDRSIEAVNHLAELTSNTEELADWQLIAAGVTAKFGDSLPIEGLTEAANETAKVGQVTGPLADALNWAGISEDKFNESLKKCNSEQERASLITKTLNTVYAEAGQEYNTLTAETQKARLETAKMEEAQAALGAKLEPLTTAWTALKTRGLEAITPVIESVVNGIMGLTTKTSILTAEQQKLIETSMQVAAKFNEMKAASDENAIGIASQFNYVENLANELIRLADATGVVQEADKARVEYILSELNSALGKEYTLTGNIITNYQAIKDSIYDVIEAKKAQILLAEYEDDYAEAIKNVGIQEDARSLKVLELADALAKYEEKQSEVEKLIAEKDADLLKHISQREHTAGAWRNMIVELQREEAQAKESFEKIREELKETDDAYKNSEQIKIVYEEASSLILQNKTEEALKLLDDYGRGFLSAADDVGEGTKKELKLLEDKVINTSIQLGLLEEEYKESQANMTEYEKKEMKNRIANAEKQAQDARKEYKTVGGNLVEGLIEGVEDKDGNTRWNLAGKFKTLVDNALQAAKKAADINSPSGETEWIAEMMMDGLSVGITKNTNQVISDINNVGRSMITAMAEESSKVVKTLEDEIKKTTEARDNAYKQEIKDLEKQISNLDDIRNDSNKKTIDAQKKTLQKELKILKEKKEAKQEELAAKKTALQEELNIEKEKEKALTKYADTFEKQMLKFSELEKDYVDKGKQIFEKLDTDIASAQNSYDSAFANRVNAIKSSLGLFNVVEKGEKVKGTDLTKALKSQVSALSQYNTALDTLSGKNVSQAFIDELKAMGVDALPELQAINKMTDKQLTDYVALWEEKNTLATQAATSEMETQRKETEAEIALLKENADKDFAELRANYRNELLLLSEELALGLTESGETGLEKLGEFVNEYVEMGKELMNGVAAGIETQEAGVISSMVNGIKRALEAAKAEMGIHSPSDVTKDELGANMALGVGEGWKDTLSHLKNSLSSSLADTVARLRATVAAENARFATSPGVADTGFNDLARAVGTQTAGINSLASEYRRGSSNMHPVIIELDKRELGRAIVDVGGGEENRIGAKLSVKGGVKK